MIDVQQIALALRACTKRSLVIVDEFGKGTASQGEILFAFDLWKMVLVYFVLYWNISSTYKINDRKC